MPTKSKSSKSSKSKSSSSAKKSSGGGRGKANSAFMKPVNVSPDLAKVVGSKPMPRTEVTKKLWNYIKQHKLQDRSNKRQINADDNLRPVFGNKDSVTMFEMTKLVSRHLS